MAKKADTKETKKAMCPITRKQFTDNAKPLTIKVGDRELIGAVKEFSTQSLGWYANDKITIEIDGVPCKVQANISLVIVGSKEAAE